MSSVVHIQADTAEEVADIVSKSVWAEHSAVSGLLGNAVRRVDVVHMERCQYDKLIKASSGVRACKFL